MRGQRETAEAEFLGSLYIYFTLSAVNWIR